VKVRSIEKKNHVISTTATVTLETTREAADELRAALAIVDKHKKAAMKALKWQERNADWTMIGYGVKNDAVIVTVEQGMAG